MMIGHPAVLAEVTLASDEYEVALAQGDTDRLNELFWDDDRAVRIGDADMQLGYAEIARYRSGAGRSCVVRQNNERRVTVFGRDLAMVHVISRYPQEQRLGRQSQLWLRTSAGWRVAHAHVSRATGAQEATATQKVENQ